MFCLLKFLSYNLLENILKGYKKHTSVLEICFVCLNSNFSLNLGYGEWDRKIGERL